MQPPVPERRILKVIWLRSNHFFLAATNLHIRQQVKPEGLVSWNHLPQKKKKCLRWVCGPWAHPITLRWKGGGAQSSLHVGIFNWVVDAIVETLKIRRMFCMAFDGGPRLCTAPTCFASYTPLPIGLSSNVLLPFFFFLPPPTRPDHSVWVFLYWSSESQDWLRFDSKNFFPLLISLLPPQFPKKIKSATCWIHTL